MTGSTFWCHVMYHFPVNRFNMYWHIMAHPSCPSRLNLCPQRDSDCGCLPFMSNLCLSFPRGSVPEWLQWWLRLIRALFSIFPLSFNNDNDRSIGNHEISTPNHEDMDGISENESRLVKYEFQDHMLLFSFRSNDRSIWYNDAIFICIYTVHVSYMQICVYYLSLSRLWLNLQLVMAVEVLMKGGGQAGCCGVSRWILGFLWFQVSLAWLDFQEKVRRFLWS